MKRNSTKVGEPIPDEDHVVRYRKRDIWKMMEGRNFDPDIFESRRHPQAGISVNWLEYYGNATRRHPCKRFVAQPPTVA